MDLFTGREVFEAVCEEVGVRVTEYKRAKFHYRDKTTEILDLLVGVTAIDNTGEIKELGTLIDFRPETLLEGLLGGTLCSDLFYEIKVSENTDDFREAVRLENVDELECFL